MLPVALDKIDAAYLLGVPEAGGPAESRTVDYKRDFTRNKGEIEGSELRADVSAFANSEGGDLVIGVDEAAGLPVKVDGIPYDDTDKLKLRIDGMLSTIEPRLAYALRVVRLPTGRVVVIVRTRPSFAAPHRTSSAGGFYVRSDSGKYPMSIDQVREAFVASAGLEGRLRAFRSERLDIVGKARPYTLTGGPRAIVHFLPLVGATRPGLLDIIKHRSKLGEAGVPCLEGGYPKLHVNFDGLQIAYPDDDGVNDGYCQWFRSGFCEVAWHEGEEVTPGRSLSFPVVRDEAWRAIDEIQMGRCIFNTVRQLLAICSSVDVPPPYFIGVSLLNCRGYELGAYFEERQMMRRLRGGRPVEIDRLVVPEVVAEDVSVDLKALLQPVFNQIANAFGLLTASDYE